MNKQELINELNANGKQSNLKVVVCPYKMDDDADNNSDELEIGSVFFEKNRIIIFVA